jgi:hypothetical protein
MSYTIFAGVPAAALTRVLGVLAQSGYQSEEISLMSLSAGKLPDPAPLTWQVQARAVFAQGPLQAHFSRNFAASLGQGLQTFAVPAYAIRLCESVLARGGVLLAVHTDNGYEPELIMDLLGEGGCQRIAVAAGPTDLIAA